jgi:asparagine synthase (glutamine-hydrolysing)
MERGLALIAHRGPDAQGLALWPNRKLAFGHRRLSIIDLSERANQPMSSADGSVSIVFNGEIYNYAELKKELAAGGVEFKTDSDTEVLLAGYRAWGLAGVLKRSAGMFAFALWDDKTQKLMLARDRAGKKPLYYAEDRGVLAFGSELAAVQALRPRRAEMSKLGLEAFLTLKFAPSPLTLVDGLRKVPPGHFLEAGLEGRRLMPYWSPLGAALPEGDPADLVDVALSVASRRRLVSDVPVCLFLSGGIDSSLIAHKITEAGAKGMAAYTVGYSDMPGYNEFDYARMVADKFPVDHREVIVSSAEVQSVLLDDDLVLDDPITDWVWVPLHFLAKRARGDGFKVVLLGEGSDELFFGYDSMAAGLRDLKRFRFAAWRGLARVAYRAGQPVYALSHRGHRRFDLWRRAATGAPVYWGSSIGFPRTQRAQLAGPALGPAGADPAGDFVSQLYQRYEREARDPEDLVNLICFTEFYTKMNEVLLHRVDRITMKHSLEARAPFLDHELCELAFAVPGAVKTPGGELKGLLKQVALRHLPPPVVRRPKMGFSFPFKEWLRGPLGPVVETTFEKSRLFKDEWIDGPFCRRLLHEHRGGRIDHAPRLWMLYSLARWYDRWLA